MDIRPLVFIDTETTGLDASRHELIEVAGIIVDIQNQSQGIYTVLDSFVYKIHPTRITDADPNALKINHYDPSHWIDALDLKTALTLVAEKTKGAVMIGHNVTFDFMFLDKAFKQTGVMNTMHYHLLDTISIAYTKLKDQELDIQRFGLQYLCEYFNIPNKDSHTAFADAEATFELYKKLMSL